MSESTVSGRRARMRAHFDPTRGRGLEVGPLATPMVRRDEGDVRYVDFYSADGLREHYLGDPGVPSGLVEEVDYILTQDDGTLVGIAEAAATGAPFDWVCASHVIEHVPDVIGWLAELAAIMADGARLALLIPDRRFCFDAGRPPTTVGEMLLAHERRDSRPSVRAVFDSHADYLQVSTADIWRGQRPDRGAHLHTVEQAMAKVERTACGDYVDCHVWLFTPDTLVDQLALLARIGLLDFALVDVTPTAWDELDFYATLERLPRAASAAERREAFDASATPIRARLAARSPQPIAPDSDIAAALATASPELGVHMLVGAREQRALLAKRSAVAATRAGLGRIRGRAQT